MFYAVVQVAIRFICPRGISDRRLRARGGKIRIYWAIIPIHKNRYFTSNRDFEKPLFERVRGHISGVGQQYVSALAVGEEGECSKFALGDTSGVSASFDSPRGGRPKIYVHYCPAPSAPRARVSPRCCMRLSRSSLFSLPHSRPPPLSPFRRTEKRAGLYRSS